MLQSVGSQRVRHDLATEQTNKGEIEMYSPLCLCEVRKVESSLGSNLLLFSRYVQVFCNSMDYIAHQASLSMGFPRQEYWSRLPFPSPGDLPDLGIEPESPSLAGGFFATEPPGKRWLSIYSLLKQFLLKGMQ